MERSSRLVNPWRLSRRWPTGSCYSQRPQAQNARKKKERVERLKEIINPDFRLRRNGPAHLGAHWRRLTPAEQQEFLKLFRAFLEKIYSEKSISTRASSDFRPEYIDAGLCPGGIKVINAKGEESPVVYRLKRTDGKWKVYDAVIENISIVNNYRSQFDRVISKSSFDDLKKMLRDKWRCELRKVKVHRLSGVDVLFRRAWDLTKSS